MSITELATLRLVDPGTASNPSFIKFIKKALQVLTTASGQPFSIYKQLEDPQVLYLLGHWDSLEHHGDYLRSPENLELLDDAKPYLTVESMYHVSCLKSDVPLGAPVLCIARHYIDADKKDTFETVYAQSRKSLEEYTKPYRLAVGWRVDGAEIPELVSFSGYRTIDEHIAFSKTESWKEYSKIKEWVAKVDIKHAGDFSNVLAREL